MIDHRESLVGKRVLVVGGSSGIGLGAAEAAAALGAALTICSRSEQKVEAALAQLGGQTEGAVLDAADEGAVSAFFKTKAPFDHIVVSAAQVKMAPIRELPLEQAYASMNSKFWGAYHIARAAAISPGGSLTLVSGFMSMRPRSGAAILAAINAGLEGSISRPGTRIRANTRERRLPRHGDDANVWRHAPGESRRHV